MKRSVVFLAALSMSAFPSACRSPDFSYTALPSPPDEHFAAPFANPKIIPTIALADDVKHWEKKGYRVIGYAYFTAERWQEHEFLTAKAKTVKASLVLVSYTIKETAGYEQKNTGSTEIKTDMWGKEHEEPVYEDVWVEHTWRAYKIFFMRKLKDLKGR